MDRVSEAVELFRSGAACSQAILGAYARTVGIDRATAMRMASGFAGGMRLGETCGAVTGAFMVLGLRNGDRTPTRVRRRYGVRFAVSRPQPDAALQGVARMRYQHSRRDATSTRRQSVPHHLPQDGRGRGTDSGRDEWTTPLGCAKCITFSGGMNDCTYSSSFGMSPARAHVCILSVSYTSHPRWLPQDDVCPHACDRRVRVRENEVMWAVSRIPCSA